MNEKFKYGNINNRLFEKNNKLNGVFQGEITMENRKSKKDKKKADPNIANDQLGENEIDRDVAQKYAQTNKKNRK